MLEEKQDGLRQKKNKQSMENGSPNVRNIVKENKKVKANLSSNNTKQYPIQWKPERMNIKK